MFQDCTGGGVLAELQPMRDQSPWSNLSKESGAQLVGPMAISFNSALNPCSREPLLQRDGSGRGVTTSKQEGGKRVFGRQTSMQGHDWNAKKVAAVAGHLICQLGGGTPQVSVWRHLPDSSRRGQFCPGYGAISSISSRATPYFTFQFPPLSCEC